MPSTQPATTTPPATLPSTLPDGIEIFRAGRHLDDAGVAHHFSEADLDGMAASYSPALREAPLTVGHPKDNLPAYGWVKAVTLPIVLASLSARASASVSSLTESWCGPDDFYTPKPVT